MGKFIDLTGQRFGKLVVLREFGLDKHRKIVWTCLCDCGTEKNIAGMSIRNGDTKSCGCINREMDRSSLYTRHGHAKKSGMSLEYNSWRGMNERCNNPDHVSYDRYGGRGITVVWKTFDEFYKDMGDRPSRKHSIERINVDGNYCKENCIWANPKEQVLNRGMNKNNSSGRKGVYWRKDSKIWTSLITVDRKRIHLGTFSEYSEAVEARIKAEQKYWGKASN